ncbi:MAG TPA: PQQ-binding-like beta-propeller repeat protein [Steroidobacteraceae bacterium]|nr:PQQ-binding-like beta-propeller repeat protein [Steroidobacteraceae bacterium]
MKSRLWFRIVFALVLAFTFSPSWSLQITRPHIKWAVQTDGPIRGAPTVTREAIYVGSADGFVYAVKKSGDLIWKFDTGAAIAGAPAVTDKWVIVAGRSRRVYALDRLDGSVRWSFEMQPTLATTTEWNFYTAPPVVDADQVLVPSGDGALYALEPASGKLRWKFQTGDSLRAAPLVAGGTIYQPSGDDFVYALSRDGKLRWKFETEGTQYDLSQGFIRSDIFSKPALQDRTLVFASRDGNVYAVDIDTHKLRWKFAYDTTWAMSSTVEGGAVFVGWSINNKVNALDLRTGKMKWEFSSGAHTYTTALIDGDTSYWGCADGKVYAIDKSSGKQRWTYEVGAEIYSSLTSDADTLYFGTDDGRLLAVSEAEAPVHKAFYLPQNVPDSTKGFIVDARLGPHLLQHGYEQLDSAAALKRWIDSRTRSGEPSVLVFGYSMIPESVLGADPATGPMRRYLESGGKVVWMSGAPNRYRFDVSGKFQGFTPQIPAQLLGISVLDFEDSGNYFAHATQAGRNWGLPESLKTSYAVLPPESTEDVVPLAIDEYGRVTAFLKRFVPVEGTGWISFVPTGYGVPMKQSELELVEHIASYTLD